MPLKGIKRHSWMVYRVPGPVCAGPWEYRDDGEMVSAEASGFMRRSKPTPFIEAFFSQWKRSSRSHQSISDLVPRDLGVKSQGNLPDNYIFSQLSRQSIYSILSLCSKHVLSKQSYGYDS